MNCSSSHCITSSSSNDSNGLPGETIEEKTRSILGWTEESVAFFNNERFKTKRSFDSSPYVNRTQMRFRKSSGQDFSAPIRSLLNQTCGANLQSINMVQNERQSNVGVDSKILHHPFSTSDILERFRREMPQLSKQRDKFKILVQTAINVIELETKLSYLKQETASLTKILNQENNDFVSTGNLSRSANEMNQNDSSEISSTAILHDMPDDLQSIDVTAFKSMVSQNEILRSSGQFLEQDKTFDEQANSFYR